MEPNILIYALNEFIVIYRKIILIIGNIFLTLSPVNIFEHFRFCFKKILINQSGQKVPSNQIFYNRLYIKNYVKINYVA